MIRRITEKGVTIRAGGLLFREVMAVHCRMDQYEKYFEEHQVEVGNEEVVVGVVAPQPINIPLEVVVGPVAGSTESPSPSPSPRTPCPQVPSPTQGSPLGDAPSFMGFNAHEDIVDLEQGAVDARAARVNPTVRIAEPDVSPNLKTFLRLTLGAQWVLKLIRESGEVLIEQPEAYLAGYNQLTIFNRRQWLRLFPAWTAQKSRQQLELLADAGGFWVL